MGKSKVLNVGVRFAISCAVATLFMSPAGSLPAYASDGTDEVEKIESPTVQKEIAEVDQSGSLLWGDVADAQVGVEVPYRVIGTLPSNWDDFDAYYYEFHDMLDPQLVIDVSSVKITLAGGGASETDLTSGFEVAVSADNVLTAKTVDLKSLAPTATKTSKVVLTYTAHLDPKLATPGTGDPADNYVYLNYTSKPWTDALGRTVEDQAQLLTWGIDLHKVAAAQETSLAGARFTVQNARGEYLKADGTLSNSPVEHETDAQGVIHIPGVDAGTYTVTETRAPEGYQKLDRPFTITLTSLLSLDASSVQAEVSYTAVQVEGQQAGQGAPRIKVFNAAVGEPPVGGLAQTGDAALVSVCVLSLTGLGCCVVAATARRKNQ